MELERQIQEFLEARRLAYFQPDTYRQAHQALRLPPADDVRRAFESRIARSNPEDRAESLAGFTLFYGDEATPTLVEWITDASPTVRWVVCGCLHDRGDVRAQAALEERLRQDPDPAVRGGAASALGRLGGPGVLPQLSETQQRDHEADPLGHTPSSQAADAITELLRRWVIRQIQGRGVRTFEEWVSGIHLSGRVVAERIPVDEQGRILQTPRYAHLPVSLFGNGWGTNLDLQTELNSPFEIEVTAVAASCTAARVFVFHVLDSPDMNLAVSTLLVKSVTTPEET